MQFCKEWRYDRVYMEIAHAVSRLSHDTKTKVGAIIVRDGQIISQGWNGMPSGMSNDMRDDHGKTKIEVLHSETNALMKLTKTGGGSNGATIYCTHSPCMDCAKLILQAGIDTIVYDNIYCNESMNFMNDRFQMRRIQHVTREGYGVFD